MKTINIPVGEDEKEYRVSEILQLASSYYERKEFSAARILYARAADSSRRGMIEYAKFLLKVPNLENMNQSERYKKAELLLSKLDCCGNKKEAAEACTLLAGMYSRTKEIRALGYMMRSYRYEGCEDFEFLARLNKRIAKLSIRDIESDPYGCYLSGMEASQYVDNSEVINWACYFLQVAVKYGEDPYVGIAALRLAELYQDTCPDAKLAAEYLRAAAEHGNPDILTRRKAQMDETSKKLETFLRNQQERCKMEALG